MDLTSAQQAAAEVYRVLTDLGGFLAGILALIAGFLVYAGGARQARAVRRAAAEQIAALQEQMAQSQRSTQDADQRRRQDLRFALALEAARVSEFVAHRYRVIPMEYGPGKLETIARSACETFKIEKAAILRDSPGATGLLEQDIIAAAVSLDEKIDAANSLLAVEGALGRLPAIGLMTAFENVTEAAQRLRAATMNGAVATAEPEEPSRGVAWLRAGAGAGNRRPVALEEERPPLSAGASR
jgi:hypothetical protein